MKRKKESKNGMKWMKDRQSWFLQHIPTQANFSSVFGAIIEKL